MKERVLTTSFLLYIEFVELIDFQFSLIFSVYLLTKKFSFLSDIEAYQYAVWIELVNLSKLYTTGIAYNFIITKQM